jgi:glycyl-tRNA synthetase beta subunit
MANTTQQPISNQVDGQSQVDERLRQAILDKKQAQIEAWSQQIEHLQQALQSVSSELRVEAQKRVIALTDARDQALTQVESLKRASQENWHALLMQTDHLFQDLATRFHDFVEPRG